MLMSQTIWSWQAGTPLMDNQLEPTVINGKEYTVLGVALRLSVPIHAFDLSLE